MSKVQVIIEFNIENLPENLSAFELVRNTLMVNVAAPEGVQAIPVVKGIVEKD